MYDPIGASTVECEAYNIEIKEPLQKKDKAQELDHFLAQNSNLVINKASLNVLDCIKEMAVFEGSNDCPKMLKKLHYALKSLPPSLVEAERCFSAAGLFITKLRTSLSDK